MFYLCKQINKYKITADKCNYYKFIIANIYQNYIIFYIQQRQRQEIKTKNEMGKKRAIYKKQQVPFFIKKLFDILENNSISQIIAWSPSGICFNIHNQSELASKILPSYFKHHNLASFIRQLNLYGFHKLQNTTEYSHQHLNRDKPDEMKLIKRTIKIKKKASSNKQKQKQQRRDILNNSEELEKLTMQNQKLRQQNIKLIEAKNQNNKILRRLKACTKKSNKFSQKSNIFEQQVQKQLRNEKKRRYITKVKNINKMEAPDLQREIYKLQKVEEIQKARNRYMLDSEEVAGNLNDYL